MITMLLPYMLWIKALHVIAVICWMAGQFYLPRLFVYHCQTEPGTTESERFKQMEHRLLRYIINPAMIVTFLSGAALVMLLGEGIWSMLWWQVKFAALVPMFIFHAACARWRRHFAADQNPHSERFYRVMNEVPTVLMLVIVIMVVVKPFM